MALGDIQGGAKGGRGGSGPRGRGAREGGRSGGGGGGDGGGDASASNPLGRDNDLELSGSSRGEDFGGGGPVRRGRQNPRAAPYARVCAQSPCVLAACCCLMLL
jgi:hypothetical protein